MSRPKLRYVKPSTVPSPFRRQNGQQLSRAARRARAVQELRHHLRTDHAGQRIAPLNLGVVLYDEQDAPLLCDLCGEAFTSGLI